MTGSVNQFFLGPRGDNVSAVLKLFEQILNANAGWRQQSSGSWAKTGHTLDDESLKLLSRELGELTKRYSREIPFFSPRYMAQMIHDTPLPALLG